MSRAGASTRRAVVGALSATAAARLFSGMARAAVRPGPDQLDAEWRASIARFEPAARKWRSWIAARAGQGPFAADWASLQGWRAPQWYQDARFGIFVHWGLYSVPAFGSEWYSRNMYQPGTAEFAHHRATYGPQDRFGYKDFIPRFRAERFDPKAWAELFRAAGARYVVPVAEHHDGFAMYASELSDWTAARRGPMRDVIGELAQATREAGLRFGVSSHRAEHDWFFDGGRTFAADVQDPAYAALYGPAQKRLAGKGDEDLMGDFTYVSQAWLADWSARTAELVGRYSPDLVYFDWWIGHPAFRTSLPPFLAAYYNAHVQARGGEAAVVNYKLGEFAPGAGVLDIERGQAPDIQKEVWQTCSSISRKSWGYIQGDSYKGPQELVHLLVDVVSKNGNLLLNVGPRADGEIPQAAQDTFRAMGRWLSVNGEAIYGSRPWRRFGEGPTAAAAGAFAEANAKPYTYEDVRFTTREGGLYAILLGWPPSGTARIASIGSADAIVAATLLADGRRLAVRQAADGLFVQLPAQPVGEFAHVLRLERS